MESTYIAKIFINLDNGDKILYDEISLSKDFSNDQLNQILNDCLSQISHNTYLQFYKTIIFTNHVSKINIETSVDYHY